MQHVLAINYCYAHEYVKARYIESAVDKHAVRTCYLQMEPSMQPNMAKVTPAVLDVGKSCEHKLDTTSDNGLVAYRNCIFEQLDKLSTLPPS